MTAIEPTKSKTKRGRPGLVTPAPELVDISTLNFAAYNPRTMPPHMMAALKASLLEHGLVLNLVAQRKGMVLIGGHQRVRALRELCAERGLPETKQAWTTVLDVSDRQARRLNVALNRIEGEFDEFRLGELLAGLEAPVDLAGLGFSEAEAAELIALARPPDELAAELEASIGDLDAFARSVTLTVEFETVEDRDRAKALLSVAAKKLGKKAGTALLMAMQRKR